MSGRAGAERPPEVARPPEAERRPEPEPGLVTLKEVRDPGDPDLATYHAILRASLPDPNQVDSLRRIQRYLAEGGRPERSYHVLLVKLDGRVAGGVVFNYAPATNFAYSEYLAVDAALRGRGLGWHLVRRRDAILVRQAVRHGRPRPEALLIDLRNPDRMPADLLERERAVGADPLARRAIMARYGFWRAAIPYVQPPIAPDKAEDATLDLAVRPLEPRYLEERSVPGPAVVETLAPIWRLWCGDRAEPYVRRLASACGGRVRLEPLG